MASKRFLSCANVIDSVTLCVWGIIAGYTSSLPPPLFQVRVEENCLSSDKIKSGENIFTIFVFISQAISLLLTSDIVNTFSAYFYILLCLKLLLGMKTRRK